jgi:hypothetical protein
LRNRISHHHKLQAANITHGEAVILELARAIDPDFSLWLQSISKIEMVLKSHPDQEKVYK